MRLNIKGSVGGSVFATNYTNRHESDPLSFVFIREIGG